MGVWQVPDDRIQEIGPRMAAFRGISHCYERPTYADWPYQIFTMAHGRSKEECDAILDAIAAEFPEIEDRATLYSSTEFKKIRLLYFTRRLPRVGARARGRLSPRAAAGERFAARHPFRGALRRAPGGTCRAASTLPFARCARSDAIPLFVERGEGAEITDVDGNTYVDYVCSWGPLILGHAHPAVVASIQAAARAGTTLRRPHCWPRSISPRKCRGACRASRCCV